MKTIAALQAFYGDPPRVEPRDPFEAILFENAAYLVDDERRARVFRRLKRDVGIKPAQLLDAGIARIEKAIASDGGMQPSRRAAKVFTCAQIAVEFAAGNLLAALKASDRTRRRLLKRFPGIADPGADKLLLFSGLSDAPALESNGLRVLVRLGFVREQRSYAAIYRDAIRFLTQSLGATPATAAFELLRLHGRELCTRTNPSCGPCPLRKTCPSARQFGFTSG
jgi:endonuclease-3